MIRKAKKLLVVRVLLAVALLCASWTTLAEPKPALACDCDIPRNAAVGKERADAVFSGKVVEIEAGRRGQDGYDAVKLDVKQSWKGIDGPQATVYTDWSSCQFDFQPGGEYLLYTYEYDGRQNVTNCGRSGELAQAAEDVRELGAGKTFETAASESGANRASGTEAAGVGSAEKEAASAAETSADRGGKAGVPPWALGGAAAVLLAAAAAFIVSKRRGGTKN
ncbi:hypothetical protein QWJ34_11995 [Saccharibacillus sp. CPCC 101409]|uniref:hypothetical protein n=1 Tax=Saccharibacillus sp. CPCC 101409 TaxID=3058041 RepID=UPI002671F421|nr:hypothetical protein [Saccharibacillus sp. CPCC 101409]MDO3410483.1 hypothetical protein [Saccharibacillus sp. CPCC 101409]